MTQEKILKIIKGLNKFQLDDIVMMLDIDETEAENIINNLITEEKVAVINENNYRYIKNLKTERILLRPDKKPANNFKNINFKDTSEYFLMNHALLNCTPATFKTYKSLIKTHLNQFFGKMQLKNINQYHLQEYIELKQQEKLSSKRINSSLTLLGNIFNKCIEWEFIDKSPYNGIINVKIKKKNYVTILTRKEAENLLSVAKLKYPKLYSMILFILETGLKKGELLALKKEDIDFKNLKIKVNKTLFEDKIVIPKSTNVIRQVDITKKLIAEIKTLTADKLDEDFVFDPCGLSHFTQDRQLRINFAKLAKETGLCGLKFNELRHTYAYNAIQSGMRIDYLHKQLGDYLIQATMDKYRDFIPERVFCHAR
jgi:integrase